MSWSPSSDGYLVNGLKTPEKTLGTKDRAPGRLKSLPLLSIAPMDHRGLELLSESDTECESSIDEGAGEGSSVPGGGRIIATALSGDEGDEGASPTNPNINMGFGQTPECTPCFANGLSATQPLSFGSLPSHPSSIESITDYNPSSSTGYHFPQADFGLAPAGNYGYEQWQIDWNQSSMRAVNPAEMDTAMLSQALISPAGSLQSPDTTGVCLPPTSHAATTTPSTMVQVNPKLAANHETRMPAHYEYNASLVTPSHKAPTTTQVAENRKRAINKAEDMINGLAKDKYDNVIKVVTWKDGRQQPVTETGEFSTVMI